jgi:hypothetical protein
VALLPVRDIAFAKHVTGTHCTGFEPTKAHTTRSGQAATSLTGAEYKEFIKEVCELLKGRGPMIWVHDRDPAHTSDGVSDLLTSLGHVEMLLPPRSPDLDPLDYAVFGGAKAWLDRERPVLACAWKERCMAFYDHLTHLQPSKLVGHYQDRLEMVVHEHGGHIEGKMKKRS